jgi:hypothetical protein
VIRFPKSYPATPDVKTKTNTLLNPTHASIYEQNTNIQIALKI